MSTIPTSCGPLLGESGVREPDPDPSLLRHIALITITMEEAEEGERRPTVRKGQRAGFHA